MTNRFLRHFLWIPLIFLLVCCASASTKTTERTAKQEPAGNPLLRIVYCAGSTGHFSPCPT